MDFPYLCRHCNTINMVEMTELSKRPVDKLRSSWGYVCEKCGEFNSVLIMTNSLSEAIRKLQRYPASHPDFQFHFAKTLKKALGVQGK